MSHGEEPSARQATPAGCDNPVWSAHPSLSLSLSFEDNCVDINKLGKRRKMRGKKREKKRENEKNMERGGKEMKRVLT